MEESMRNDAQPLDTRAGHPPQPELSGWIKALVTLTELPKIGDWVSLALVAIPVLPLLLLASAIGLLDQNGHVVGMVLLVVFGVALGWLQFLRRRTGLTFSWYFIPWIWIAWAGILFGVYGTVTGQP
jgi:hypothetical protein